MTDRDCIGPECVNPHPGHTRDECETVEMHEAQYIEQSSTTDQLTERERWLMLQAWTMSPVYGADECGFTEWLLARDALDHLEMNAAVLAADAPPADTQPLVWTSESPTEEGWYFRDTGPSECVCVYRDADGKWWCDCNVGPLVPLATAHAVGYRWAGPIPEPAEPQEQTND